MKPPRVAASPLRIPTTSFFESSFAGLSETGRTSEDASGSGDFALAPGGGGGFDAGESCFVFCAACSAASGDVSFDGSPFAGSAGLFRRKAK